MIRAELLFAVLIGLVQGIVEWLPISSQGNVAIDDGKPAQPDTDKPERNALNEPHQRVDGDVADDRTRREGDKGDEHGDTG